MKFLYFLALPFILTGCFLDEPTLEDQTKSLYSYFEKNRFGSGTDYAILKSSALTENEPVAIVFGYIDDHTVCEQLADTLRKDGPMATFTCSPLNTPKR
jgi:hypothetical protein